MSANPTDGAASASRRTTSAIACASATSPRRNFSRAGVARNRPATSTTVPGAAAQGSAGPARPPSQAMRAPSPPAMREAIVTRATAPSEASASPRNPNERIASRSVPSILEVACRASAIGRSAAPMPWPSSVTRIRVLPPPE